MTAAALPAVAGVHASIPVRVATQEQLVVGDLLECEGWSCEHAPDQAVARVVDGDGLKLNDACAACLPMVAGWWARSRMGVVAVWTPWDAEEVAA